jgi:hypothetical protein
VYRHTEAGGKFSGVQASRFGTSPSFFQGNGEVMQ